MRDFLVAENAYADRFMTRFARLRQSWEDEWWAAQPASPSTPLFARGGFVYETQVTAGARQLTRRRPEARRLQVVVDSSVYGARGLGFNQGGIEISPDNRLAAIAFERAGSERFSLRLRDIDRNRDLGYVIEPVGPSIAWLDRETLLYTRLDGRGVPVQVWCHRVGHASADVMLHQDRDPAVFVAVSSMASGRFGVIASHLHSSTELRLVPVGGASFAPHLVMARQPGVRYDVQYHPDQGGLLFALVRDDTGSRLVLSRGPGPASWSQWTPVYVPPAQQRAVDFSVGAGQVIVAESGRDPRLVVLDAEGGQSRSIALPGTGLETSFRVQFSRDFHQPEAWVVTTGPTDPGTYHEVNPVSGATRVMYRVPAPRHFDPDRYVVERWMATAPDGVTVPMSVFYARAPKGRRPGERRPALLEGYGAFGISHSPGFSRPALSLADRGWVLAHAYVRGGGDFGPAWHAAGRRMHKRNSISDFLACAQQLAANDLVDATRIGARGASAGGLLVCAAMNERPDLFRTVVARVPFVDCLTSLLDSSDRLTQSGWDEFGNPIADIEVYRCIQSYSPYDNIRPVAYPSMLVTAGFRDARVPYWVPAKYVAKLRATKTDQNLLLLRTAMGSGHNNRFDQRSDESYIMAFLVSQLE